MINIRDELHSFNLYPESVRFVYVCRIHKMKKKKIVTIHGFWFGIDRIILTWLRRVFVKNHNRLRKHQSKTATKFERIENGRGQKR